MLTSIFPWLLLADERRTVDGVIKSWSVDPQTRKPKVVEEPAIRPQWSWAARLKVQLAAARSVGKSARDVLRIAERAVH